MRISDWSSDVCSSDLNDAHQVVGSAYGAAVESFLRDPATGALTMFQIEGRPTRARGINNAGLITGFHTDATGRVATFVAHSGGYQLLYINASDDTIGEATNDAGKVSGLFSTPVPASPTQARKSVGDGQCASAGRTWGSQL